jgi:hypothetical protein
MAIKSAIAALALVGLAAAGATPASAEAGCDSRSKILSALDQEYKESPVGIGLTQSGRVIELLVSRKGSWTLLATGPTGMSCLIAAGENWEAMALPEGDKS